MKDNKLGIIQVVKRDGSKENFEPFKIQRIALATGLNDEEASIFQKNVVKSVKELTKNNKEIKSKRIRDIFIKELEAVNKYAAGLYTWYENTKGN